MVNIKKILRSAEAVVWTLAACMFFRCVHESSGAGFDGLGAFVLMMFLAPAMLIAAYIRIGLTRFTFETLKIAGIVDNAYLCTVSALTIRAMHGDFFFLHLAAMAVLNLMLYFKSPDRQSNRLTPMWAAIAVIQAAGLAVIFSSGSVSLWTI